MDIYSGKAQVLMLVEQGFDSGYSVSGSLFLNLHDNSVTKHGNLPATLPPHYVKSSISTTIKWSLGHECLSGVTGDCGFWKCRSGRAVIHKGSDDICMHKRVSMLLSGRA